LFLLTCHYAGALVAGHRVCLFKVDGYVARVVPLDAAAVAIVRTGDVAADRGVHRRLADAQGVGGAAAGATSAEPEAVAAHCAASASAARAAASALQSLVDRLGPPQGVVPVLGLGALQRERRGGHLELIEVHTVQRIVRRQLNDQLVGQVRLPDDLQGPQSPLGDRLAHQEEIRE